MALTRVQDILIKARDTLADPKQERWTDDRLIRLIDEGQLDIAKHSRILKGEANLIPVKDQAIYDLPSDIWLLTRAAYDGCKISLRTHDELDELVRTRAINMPNEQTYNRRYGSSSSDFGFPNFCWELEKGSEVDSLVYDRRNMGEIRFFPIPTNDPAEYIIDLFGVATAIDSADYTFSSDFGVVTGATDPDIDLEVIDKFGVIVGTTEATGIVHIWYIKMPAAVEIDTDDLEIPEMWDTALKFYVISNAFDDDYDSKFAEKSKKAALLYQRELDLIAKTDFLDGTRASTRRTDYRGAFER